MSIIGEKDLAFRFNICMAIDFIRQIKFYEFFNA
jgi:hypothetical protein